MKHQNMIAKKQRNQSTRSRVKKVGARKGKVARRSPKRKATKRAK